MPFTAKLSRRFYDHFGDELTNEFVDLINGMDATYKSELREMNELNFARFDAKLEQRVAELRTEIVATRAEMRAEMHAQKADLIKWVHETAQRPAGEYWDLQLIQNYIYPRATYGEEPFAGNLAQPADKMINIFPLGDINVVVVGGGTNGYWQIIGATYRKTISVDAWR